MTSPGAVTVAEVERIWLPFAVWLVTDAGLLPPRQIAGGRRWARWLVNHLLLTT